MRLILCLLAFLFPIAAFGQSTILQSGPTTPGHVPMFVGVGTMQPIVQDSGTAGGGGNSVGLSELGVTIRNPLNVYPAANVGNGPYNTNICDYDAPTTNATGYHYICISPNSLNGELIAVGAGGGAAQLPFFINVNGSTYSFPFVVGGIVGPGSTTSGDLVLWNNTTGTLVKDASQITLAQMPTLLTNQIYANVTSGSSTPLGFSVPSCSTSASYLQWTTNTGLTCGTAIAAPAGSLTGNVTCAHNDGPYTGDITKTQGSCATTVTGIQGTAVGTPTGTASSAVVLATSPTITTPTINQLNWVGDTTSATNPTAGSVGERLSASTNAVPVSSGVATTLISRSITAGHWACTGSGATVPTGTTTTSITELTLSLTTNTNGVQPAQTYLPFAAAGSVSVIAGLAPIEYDFTTTTTVYLVADVTFAVSTMGVGGSLTCQRVW